MAVLSELRPQKVFEFFELLSSVPHGSGNTRAVSDLCVAFAKERGLFCRQDDLNNVVIFKPATAGKETSAPIILQGHLDMVCAKEEGSPVDMAKDPIQLLVEGDFVKAQGTSLGGDNGIAVAIILAILDDDTLSHPKIEAVFTTDEETGMDGAMGLDMSILEGRRLLNLDSEEEGIFTVSCAGGARVDCSIPAYRQAIPKDYCLLRAEISGLMGGHSGVDIDKGRGSANQLMGRMLYSAWQETPFCLVSLFGGTLDNVIPQYSEAVIAVKKENAERLFAHLQQYHAIYQNELAADPNVTVRVEMTEKTAEMVAAEATETMLFTLLTVPYHIQAMSMDIPGLVQTSLNMGVLRLKNEELCFSFSVRSSIQSQKEMIIERLKAILHRVGGTTAVRSAYPGWSYSRVSPLRELILKVYREQTGKEGVVSATHGGLECGMFIEKLPGLDCVSCGPDLYDVHSVRERLSISSTERLWKLVCELLMRA